jgi:hypothetical protein
MKKFTIPTMGTMLYAKLPLLIFFLASCTDKCEVTNSYTYFEPVYTTKAEVKASIALKGPQPIINAGRIYFKDGILFINESGKGIHIIDNHDPSHPMPLSFLNIPGNFDLSIIRSTLYADSFVDLISFDISNLQDIKEIGRMEGLFNHYSTFGFTADATKGLVTDWKEVKKVSVTESTCQSQRQPWGGIYYKDGIGLDAMASSNFNATTALAPTSTTGIGGSMARFTIVDGHLYALDDSYLDIVDVGNPQLPAQKNEIQLGWWPETLFPRGETLFIGTRAGLYIYDLHNPIEPKRLSAYEHIISCDPVVVEGNYAFVTLYNGGICHNSANQLEVVNISNPSAPSLTKIYPFTSPHGLGIDNGILFICDGDAGLKIYDATDVTKIADNQLAHYPNINALDIIPFNNIAMMIGSDGLYQYNYADLKNIKLLSKISIAQQ